jgi:hypothetical protein
MTPQTCLKRGRKYFSRRSSLPRTYLSEVNYFISQIRREENLKMVGLSDIYFISNRMCPLPDGDLFC